MADNVVANAGSGGATFAADDIGGVHYPRSKIALGADGTNDGDVAQGNPLPVEIRTPAGDSAMDDTTDTLKVSGSAAENAAVTGNPVLAGGRYDATPRTLNDGDAGALAVDATGSLQIVHAALTELAAAINSSRLDINIAAQAGGVTVADGGGTLTVDDGGTTLSVDDGGGALTVDNAGTFAVQVDGDALTALQLLDDVVQTDDAAFTPATDKVAMVGATFDDTAPDSVDEGDAGALRMSSRRELYVQLRDAAGNERGLNVDASGQIAITGTQIATIAGAVSGSEMQVDVVAALPAGTNAIGKLAANSGVDIGDVDVISVVPGTAASNLGKAEDAAHSDGDVGVMALAVRNDDLAALAGSDGDYAPLQVTQNGALMTCPAANDDYKYAAIDAASSGDNTLVAAVASRKIRVLSLFMVSAGTVTTRFEDGASGTALTGQMNLVANSGFTLPFNPAGWFETSVNTLLNLELSAAVSVDGSLTYIEVP